LKKTILKKIKNKPKSWSKLPDRSNTPFLFKNAIHKNYCIFFNEITTGQVDKRLFLGKSKVKANNKIIFAVLNSVITYIGMELIGRTNLGEGALDVNVIDYKKIPILDPVWLEVKLSKVGKLDEFLSDVDKLLLLKPLNIEDEIKNEIRQKIEFIMLKMLGLNKKEIKQLYSDLLDLVNLREGRARSFKKT